jgi:acetoin utilization deacetylase AcuC-like enzyme
MGTVAYFHHPSSLEHDTGMHPERVARIQAIEARLQAGGWRGLERVQAPRVPLDALLAVHPRDYVRSIEIASLRGGGALDPDTLVSQGSYEAAMHAAGGAVSMVDRLVGDRSSRAGFCGLRPPGHHAEPTRAMGFCLFDNVAVAARHALTAHRVERVLILDWDVHHGNGTNDVFHSDPAVLFVSIHQSPLYPGTGPASDVGSGAGEGFTVNLPVPPGAGDETVVSHVQHLVVPLAGAYRPGLVLVSAGYDGHRDDPLADGRVTDAGYAAMAAAVRGVAEELDAPVGVVLEGGYDLDVLARSVEATLDVLSADEPPEGPAVPLHPLTAEARERAARYWPGLEETYPPRGRTSVT